LGKELIGQAGKETSCTLSSNESVPEY